MPNIDEEAKAFETGRAGWFGNAVGWRRKALGLTAAELSRKTAELGFPVTRGTIAKIESNLRSGKIDVAEVLVLAAALDVPPVLLLFPQVASDGGSSVLPNVFTTDAESVRWVSGETSTPRVYDMAAGRLDGEPSPPNDGVELIASIAFLHQALDTRSSLVHHLRTVEHDPAELHTAQQMLDRNADQIAAIRNRIRTAQESLWGMSRTGIMSEEDNDE
ncbi:transcriptional regulator with XRE-family HTH domain [Mycobacterium sp. OAS707]|uniref:helix-turn-helix transcriptional regulator n=1 Tax=Mycobacterium sp. OAS707 TaxID=2663822 RepID=UPI001789D111|nr:helix-turn-helix transcriptional regulator [Mycobacterium sp. OAS707]MBE1551501.1 transcriptional regulator with XRE-family HTH domain [Mycobacterium sp. OAS707]